MASPAHSILNGLRRMRRWTNQLVGRDVRTSIQAHCPREFLGSEYGGWCVCPVHINPGSLIYSFGVGQDITWDLAMSERFGVEIHAFDPTPKAVQWIRSQELPAAFHFHEFGIAGYDGTARFSLPRPDFVSYSMGDTQNQPAADVVEAPVRRLATLMHMLGHAGRTIDVLKMDVEGAEIEVIRHLPESGVDIRQLLVEFHHTVGRASEVARTRQAIETINQCGFRLFHHSPVGKEFSFIRSSAAAGGST